MKTSPKNPPASTAKARRGSHRQPEQTRQAILNAAIVEFAEEGIAGARTESIARSAGVNKALIYYYFRDKESLYGAVLDHVFGGLKCVIDSALDLKLPPRQRLLAYVGAHFDYISSSQMNPRVVMREIIRGGHNSSAQFEHISKEYLVPAFKRVAQLLREGIDSGDFRPVDPAQFIPSMVAVIVFYFTSSTVMRTITGVDPLEPKRVADRRASVLDFISAALFTSLNQGVRA